MADHLRVLIATDGRLDLLRRSLQSLAMCRMPPEYRGTIVVSSGDPDGVRDVVKGVAALGGTCLHVPEDNKSLALNRALSECEDSLVVFTDDDVRFDEAFARAYADAAASRKRGAFYGGPVLPEYEAEPAEWLKPYLPASAKGFSMAPTEDGRDFEFMHRVEPVSGPPDRERPAWRVPSDNHRRFLGINWAAFHGDLRDAGLFDARFGPGAETGSTGQETTMQDRMVDAGLERFFVPAAVVHHHVPRARCSAEWALSRAYRDGVQRGLTGRRAPASTLVALTRSTIAAAVRAVGSDPETRFRPRFERRFLLGVRRGRAMRRRLDRGG